MSDDDSRRKRVKNASRARVSGDGGQSLPTRIFGGLSNRRRRFVLYYLMDDNHADVEELATQIAAWEHNTPIESISDEQRNAIQTELIHTHLPKLTDYGFIDYDRRSEVVRFTDPPSILKEALDVAANLEKPG